MSLTNHRDTEAQRGRDALTERIIGLAIEVRRALGPGLLESAYEECLAYGLREAQLVFQRQLPLPVVYKQVQLDCAYRMDFGVERKVVLELKTVDRLLPIHDAQLLTYLRLARLPTGHLINFHAAVVKDGVRRLVL